MEYVTFHIPDELIILNLISSSGIWTFPSLAWTILLPFYGPEVFPELLPTILNISANYSLLMNLLFGFDEFVARDRKAVTSSFRQVALHKKLTSSLADIDVTNHGKTSHTLLALFFFRPFISGRLGRPTAAETDFIRDSKNFSEESILD